jgi:LysR family hydrogen peroxide-inducible transcriptional activator
MELHQLRYLEALARTRSFTRAAAECHVTQPTLSHQIRKLELELGGTLLRRSRNGAQLTTLGEKMRGHARTILSTVDSAHADATSLAQRVAGRVRLGVIPTVAPYLLPRIMARCRRRYPGLVIEISESPTATLVADLVRGELDAIVISPPVEAAPPLQLRPLFEDEFLLALPRGHRLAARRRVKLADLRDEAMILLGDAHCLRGQALELCRRAGYAPRIAIQSAQLDTVLGLVEAGLGLSLVPASARPTLRHRNVQFRPLGPERASRQIVLAWLHPAVPVHFLEAVAEIARAARPRTQAGSRRDSQTA